MGLQLFGKGYPRLDTTNRVSAHYLETDVVCGKHGIIGREKKEVNLGDHVFKRYLGRKKCSSLFSPLLLYNKQRTSTKKDV